MGAFGWRFPFILGGLLGFVVMWLRRTLPETLHADAKPGSTSTDADPTGSPGVWHGLRKYWLIILAMIFIVGAVQAYNYSWTAGLPSLATGTFKEDPTAVFAITTGLSVILTIGALILSRFLDKWALSRWFILARLAAIPCVFITLFYTSPGIGAFAGVMFGGAIVLLFNLTSFNVVASSLLPQFCRATGAGLGFGVRAALFGGTSSFVLVWLQQQGLRGLFPVYVAALCAISVALYVLAKQRNGVFLGK
nr:MFS transporter [Pseudarthrobacter sp. fls2-241-R2A-168]